MFIWINLFLPLAMAFNITCPELSQRAIRSEIVCNESSQHYSCLFDEHKQKYVELCLHPDFVRPGQKYVINVRRLNTDCSSKRYQPFKFWSNTSSQCVFQKSKCSEIGQTIMENISTIKDVSCRCDYTKGFGFSVKPHNPCFCVPSEEDCSCYAVSCPLNYTLTADYKCQPETILTQITFCSKIDSSRNDKEITDIKAVSKSIPQNISKTSKRGVGTIYITYAIAMTLELEMKLDGFCCRSIPFLSIAIVVGVAIGLWIFLERTDPESLNTKTGNKDGTNNPQTDNTDIKATDQHVDDVNIELTQYERELLDWINITKSVIGILNSLAKELDVNCRSNREEKIRGSKAAIIGSVITIAGFAISPVTLGVSLSLVIAGGLTGGIGGAKIGHSLIKENVLSKHSKSIAKRELDRYSAASEIIKGRCLKLSLLLQKKGKIEDNFPEWTKFWCRIAHGQEDSKEQQKNIWNETKNIIETQRFEIQSFSRIIGEGIGTGIRISTMFTEISRAINAELPKQDDVEEMVKCTLSRL